MFPGAMNTANIKKVSELWEEEKKYRWWIIGFAASLVVLFLLNVSFVVFAYVNEDSLITAFKSFYQTNQEAQAKQLFETITITCITWTIALFLGSIAFIYSIYNCYKIKSFEKLDSFSSFFLGFQTFYSLFFVFNYRNGEFFDNTFMIFYFVLPLLSIPVWLLLARQVKRIKRSFFIAKRQEEITAFYQSNQEQIVNNGFQSPFGFPFQQPTQQSPVDANQVVDEHFEVKQDPKYFKLEKMSLEQLRKIADRLSISGIDEMTKPELIKIILSVTQTLDINNDDEKEDTNLHDSIDIEQKNN
ncbi:MAG: Rho termination factor N-terminal domain-containing protein [Metamycoplasmataceae bacterium]